MPRRNLSSAPTADDTRPTGEYPAHACTASKSTSFMPMENSSAESRSDASTPRSTKIQADMSVNLTKTYSTFSMRENSRKGLRTSREAFILATSGFARSSASYVAS